MITWNPNDKHNDILLSDNNLRINATGANWKALRATKGRAFGRWYWEIEVINFINSYSAGIGSIDSPLTPLLYSLGLNYRLFRPDHTQYGLIKGGNEYAKTPSWGKIHIEEGDILGVALNIDSGYIDFYRNGELLGKAFDDIRDFDIVYPLMTMYDTVEFITNFGATEFDIVQSNPQAWQELIGAGYLPYDTDSADWFYGLKHLIKFDNKIQILKEDKLVYPNIKEPLTQEDFEKWGMRNLERHEKEINKFMYEMEEDGVIGSGKVFRKDLNGVDLTINAMVVKKNE